MKQRYTITLADMQMNVITEESPEAVEAIVGIIDRRMREINSKSLRCSKTEAALLCALDYCSDKIKAQRRLKTLELQLAECSILLEEQENEIERLNALLSEPKSGNE